MLHLLIDANAFLDFYRMSSVDLDELQKLVDLLDTGQVTMYLTDQLVDEVKRNREKVIHEALKAAKDAKIPSAFPQIVRSQPGFAKLDAARKEFSETLSELIKVAEEAARTQSLGADVLLGQLFSKAKRLSTSDDARSAAAARVMVGNPPGKNGSHGDALSWETLLETYPEQVDLHFVTRDQDFVSPLDDSRLSEFLVEEWDEAKGSSVFVHSNLSGLLGKHYKDIRLAEEARIAKDVARLVRSGSFATTHAAISALSDIAEFTVPQVVGMCKAALENDQVSSILGDSDVNDFFWGLVRDYRQVLDDDTRRELMTLLEDNEWGTSDDDGE